MTDWLPQAILFFLGMTWGAALYWISSSLEHKKTMKQLAYFQKLSDQIATERARQEYRDQALRAYKDP